MIDPLTLVLKAKALREGRALPLNSAGRWHLSQRPLLLATALLAGEDATLLAVLAGYEEGEPDFDCTVDPRDREGQYDFFMRFGMMLTAYFRDCGSSETIPQIVVPNEATIRHLEAIAHRVSGLNISAALERSDPGRFARHLEIRTGLGVPLSFIRERGQTAGQQLIVPATTLLTSLWITGQSMTEDRQLAPVLAWIHGRDPVQAEDGPTSPRLRPAFARDIYAPALRKLHRRTADADAPRSLRDGIVGQLRPVFEDVRRATLIARGREREAPHLRQLVVEESRAFNGFLRSLGDPISPSGNWRRVTRAFELNEELHDVVEHLFATHDVPTRLRMRIAGDMIAAIVLTLDVRQGDVLVTARIDESSLLPRKNDELVDAYARKFKVVDSHLVGKDRIVSFSSDGSFRVDESLELIASKKDLEFVWRLRACQAGMYRKRAWIRDGLLPQVARRMPSEDILARLEAMS